VDVFLTGALINEQKDNPTDAVIRAMTGAVHVATRNCDNIKTIDMEDFRSSRVGELEAREMRNVSSSGGRWLALQACYIDLYYEAAGVHWIGANGRMVRGQMRS
jgi:hypothetical protein